MAYTSEEIKDLQAAAERMGLFENTRNSKIKRLAGGKDPATGKKPAKKRSKFETEQERKDRIVRDYKLKPLRQAEEVEPYDVTNPTRYASVKEFFPGDGNQRLQSILKMYHIALHEHVITPRGLRNWREHFMLMTPEQLGQLVRVSARTVRNWEAGKNEIPFSMWWMMHCTLQDPKMFLTRPGFHDFYIDYTQHPPELCSHTWPDIRYSATDLWINRAALSEVLSTRNQMKAQQDELDSLKAENTRLRQLLKAESVAAELQAMQAHIGDLLKRIHTADIIPFPKADDEAAQPKAVAG